MWRVSTCWTTNGPAPGCPPASPARRRRRAGPGHGRHRHRHGRHGRLQLANAGLITTVTTVAPDAAAAAVIAAARTHLGDKYVYGDEGPTTWDCSGFTSTLWSTVGKVSTIPRTAHLQQAWATPVPASQVLPGRPLLPGHAGDPRGHRGRRRHGARRVVLRRQGGRAPALDHHRTSPSAGCRGPAPSR